MLSLREYRRRPALLADWLPWAGLVAPGIILNKDGSFQRTARIRGPDLDSASDSDLVSVTARIHNALRRLGTGWAMFFDGDRRDVAAYPSSAFPDPTSWLIDQERRGEFESTGSHHESTYYLTLVRMPPEEGKARAKSLLYEHDQRTSMDWRTELAAFADQCLRVGDLIEGVMPEFVWLDDTQTLTYIKRCISEHDSAVAVPEVPFHLDALLADTPLVGGLSPMLGKRHLRVATVRGLPASTWPGVLDALNRVGFGFRWSTRYICMDKAEAERELSRLRRHWFSKRKGVAALLRETIFQVESPLIDNNASNQSADADAALQELGSDAVSYGYVTATVCVLDTDPREADAKIRELERVIQARGFVTIHESLNAVDAWLGSLPGNLYANVRQPIISTLNLAHMLPVSAVWAGQERNSHLNGPPLMMTRTDGSTPFRLVTHVGDVGHSMIVGPTGMGKSTLVAMLMAQFLRYPGAQVFAFDVGRSLRAMTLGLGGEHYDLGRDGDIAFQPLAQIDQLAHRAWAAEWIEGLLVQQGLEPSPDDRAMVWSALTSLAGSPVHQRTMTGLMVLLQSNALRQGLAPFVLGGAHGALLDAEADRIGTASVQCFEIEDLLTSPIAATAVLTYLVHRLAQRFDGSPTMLVLGEAWVALDSELFAGWLRKWLKTARKANVSVVFDTQSLADIKPSTEGSLSKTAAAIIEGCATRIFLPNPQASEPLIASAYRAFGLGKRQIEILTTAEPKRDYYVQSRLGNRLVDLNLRSGSVALAFAGATSVQHQHQIDRVLAQSVDQPFAQAWLRECGLDWAAELLTRWPGYPAPPPPQED